MFIIKNNFFNLFVREGLSDFGRWMIIHCYENNLKYLKRCLTLKSRKKIFNTRNGAQKYINDFPEKYQKDFEIVEIN